MAGACVCWLGPSLQAGERLHCDRRLRSYWNSARAQLSMPPPHAFPFISHRLIFLHISAIFPRNSISLKSIPYQNNNKWENFAVSEMQNKFSPSRGITQQKHPTKVYGNPFSSWPIRDNGQRYWFSSLFPSPSEPNLFRQWWVWRKLIRFAHMCYQLPRSFLLHFNLVWRKVFSFHPFPSLSLGPTCYLALPT